MQHFFSEYVSTVLPTVPPASTETTDRRFIAVGSGGGGGVDGGGVGRGGGGGGRTDQELESSTVTSLSSPLGRYLNDLHIGTGRGRSIVEKRA